VNPIVDVADFVETDPMVLATGRWIIFGEFDLIGSVEVIDRANVRPFIPNDFHVLSDL
jgi:hypothetical protein